MSKIHWAHGFSHFFDRLFRQSTNWSKDKHKYNLSTLKACKNLDEF